MKLYVDPLSFQYLEQTEIDYVEGVHGSGFKFNNPNVKGTLRLRLVVLGLSSSELDSPLPAERGRRSLSRQRHEGSRHRRARSHRTGRDAS